MSGSKILQVGAHWPGIDQIKHLVIFGDSYSTVGYDTSMPHPTHKNPLGVVFPGRTYNERDKPNWVGHLIQSYRKKTKSHKLVYDYASGGDTVGGMRRQVENEFVRDVGQRPEWAPWTSDDTLFVSWIGINDCAYGGEFNTQIDTLMQLQETLYTSGARNFLFIDVPPMERSPAASAAVASKTPGFDSATIRWNTLLACSASHFAQAHPGDTTVLLFSAHDVLTRVLDDPRAHGFRGGSADTSKAGGRIWSDRLHVTSAVHGVVTRELQSFLDAVQASESKYGSGTAAGKRRRTWFGLLGGIKLPARLRTRSA
ncbi:carbohydrate esterase family 16 protein [Coniophora puteana RWD-64-598 SS2]|uniref:Carbohydrate esterase family 16 protein n=1 Tax=Coniophora puteana (strain RWD-64-598) TaxID=741705 RepID=A0A5M3MBM8_CONPW|nr:carbohydrate esterase family 16 protein [Coniophora puteana RWD-64-598 SS2]EIW76483.1 carbohydrate esterase family 16 protein [Coniophora puteana RWD-64-598 SS2]